MQFCSLIVSNRLLFLLKPVSFIISLPETYVEGYHNVSSVQKMEYRPLGDTGLLISKLGYGEYLTISTSGWQEICVFESEPFFFEFNKSARPLLSFYGLFFDPETGLS